MNTSTKNLEEKKLLVLISVGVSDRTQAEHQTRALNLLAAKKIPYETVNGMDPNQRERRNELFQISGIRANYPQFFFITQREGMEPHTTFFGQWEKLESLNDMSTLPQEVIENALRENPNLETWDKVFGNIVS